MGPTAEATRTIKVQPHPAAVPRLFSHVGSREDLKLYRAAGGYGEVADVDQLLDSVERAGVRGRGGAAFPMHTKLHAVRSGHGVPVVVANGEEGEPASVKDRWLLRTRPHLVFDGVRLAALMTGADRAYVYVSDAEAERSVRDALDELAGDGTWTLPVDVMRVDPTYVAGEETAAVQAINGGPALPTDKPPRPFEEGVAGRPTVVSNVETLANLPFVQALGDAGYRKAGTDTSPGTFLLTLGGCGSTGLYEVPFGVTLRDVLEWLGEDTSKVTGFLMGGYFAGVLGAHALDTPLDYDAVAALGSGLGCGAVVVIEETRCPVDVGSAVMAYFARENSGQCGSCFNGTAAMSAVLQALRDHRAEESDVKRLSDWSQSLRGRGACGTLDGATNVARSVLREFPEKVTEHLQGGCGVCQAGNHVEDPPFALTFGAPAQA